MPNDAIMHYRDDRVSLLDLPGLDHKSYLSYYYRKYQGAGLPDVPADVTRTIATRVNHGRWLCRCETCGAGMLLDSDTEYILCPVCAYYGWMRVDWPAEKAEIEAELLKHPGHRLLSPVREWKPGWTLADLQGRTEQAKLKQVEGEILRALSIGATRNWTVGETLTAGNMNLYGSSILDDLKGENGLIELEDSGRILAGTAGDRFLDIPGGTLAQRPTSPGAGAIRWNTDDGAVDAYGTAWVQLLTSGPPDR